MIVQHDPELLKKLKKVNIRIRNQFFQKIKIFEKNPQAPELHNHPLKREYQGYRSINNTVDWRAVYKEVHMDDEIIAYFEIIGTHEELYSNKKENV